MPHNEWGRERQEWPGTADTRPATYIKELFKPDDRVAVFFISRLDKDRVMQKIMDARDAASEKWQGYFRAMNTPPDTLNPPQGRPWDVYIGMNPLHTHALGRTKSDVAEIRHVFMEIDKDGPAALDKILKHPAMAEPNYILTSSPERYQVVWKVTDFTPERAETLSRNMVREFGADPARIDVSSILRLPGFRNQKYQDFYHKVTVETRSRDLIGPESFPRELFETQRTREPAERQERARGSRNAGIDQSKKDFRHACEALRQLRDPWDVMREIDQSRLADGKTKHRTDYGKRTVERALLEPDVRAARERQHQRAR